ncbi:hypothetical protein [Arthrobacter sp. USHLN218]|uniref:hypothetical protein n=1 Tax=Arthrobacter sp. USHLN218 TaxID=3081232 RepID=UPI0030172CC6
MDLAEWYAAGRWVALIDLIDGLPNACRLNEAIANDPETAEYIASLPKPEGEWAPRVSEFDLTAHLLRELIHEVKALKQVSISAAGGKPGNEKPIPGPRTAIEKAIERMEQDWAADVAEKFGFNRSDF